jgi:hypothetical protein
LTVGRNHYDLANLPQCPRGCPNAWSIDPVIVYNQYFHVPFMPRPCIYQ